MHSIAVVADVNETQIIWPLILLIIGAMVYRYMGVQQGHLSIDFG